MEEEELNINDVMIKSLQSRQVVRGIQVNEPSVMNNTKMSNTSESSKKKLPKNYFALNEFIETNSSAKSQKK